MRRLTRSWTLGRLIMKKHYCLSMLWLQWTYIIWGSSQWWSQWARAIKMSSTLPLHSHFARTVTNYHVHSRSKDGIQSKPACAVWLAYTCSYKSITISSLSVLKQCAKPRLKGKKKKKKPNTPQQKNPKQPKNPKKPKPKLKTHTHTKTKNKTQPKPTHKTKSTPSHFSRLKGI